MSASAKLRTILVTGGAGYVGAALVPRLLDAGYRVRVLDLYLYGAEVLAPVRGHEGLTEIRGDLRDPGLLQNALRGVDAVIHLACISNDPSFELDPKLGRSINYDAFAPLVRASRESGVRRFVYASSSSVYGVKSEPEVTEDLRLEPLTDYSKFKALCEEILLEESGSMVPLIARPATVCGVSPRLRMDLTVNILTGHAFFNRKVIVHGGDQLRPNIHIDDMCAFYLRSLDWPDELVRARTYNVGYENRTVMEIAEMARDVAGADVVIERQAVRDPRSYRVTSSRLERELGFSATRGVAQAIADLNAAFSAGRFADALKASRYSNIQRMREAGLS